jgi:putative phosphonate metabolism protein
MTAYRRYGIYAVPHGAFYARGAAWLGWDSVAGCTVAPPTVEGLPRPVAEMTATPRKYGFHGTVKPPFRLADGMTETALRDAAAALYAGLAPVEIPALTLRRLGGFVAVVPASPVPALAHLAADTVKGLDRFRAAPSQAELDRRRKSGLSARQEANLVQWGYPYVMEEFRFHMTLTGRLGNDADRVAERLRNLFTPVLPRPYRIDDLALVGEDAQGRFRVIQRYDLSG